MIAVAGALAELNAWLAQHPQYAYTADAYEVGADGKSSDATIHVTYDSASNVETVHVVRGPSAGTDVRYAGGTSVSVRGPGFAHVISIRLPLRDPRVLSPNGNDARVAALGPVARCFAADAAHLTISQTGDTITLTDKRPSCTDGYGTLPITADQITLATADGHPLLRERLAGPTVMGRWTISDLHG